MLEINSCHEWAAVLTDLAFVDQHDSKIRFDRVQHQVIDKHASEIQAVS